MWWVLSLPSVLSADAAAATTDTGMSLALKLAIAVGVLAGSYGLGMLIARMLRLPDFAPRIGFVLCTVIAGVVICVLGWPPKKGIDLSGGVVLVYEIDQQQQHSSNLEDVVRRVNSALRGEGVAAEVNAAGQIEIPLRAAADTRRLRQRMADAVEDAQFVEQRTRGDREVLVYSFQRQQQSVDMGKMVAAISRRINPSGVKEVMVRQYGMDQIEIVVPEVEQREVDYIKNQVSTSGMLEFRIVANNRDHKDIINAAKESPAREVLGPDRKVIGRWIKLGKNVGQENAEVRKTATGAEEVLMAIDPYNVDGHYLTSATGGFDDTGRRAVHFTLNSEGGTLFGQLTTENRPDSATGFRRRLGIVLDGELLSAPTIESPITTNGQIAGSFTEDEVNSLVNILNAGSLPAALQKEPVSQQRISSQLGEDTIRKGQMSMAISMGLVILFMLIYYQFAGIVAVMALVLNVVLAVALMITIQAAFTLPGLAGLVLTVGMAVDANVLIYERMREESGRGASLRMTIRNGFSRAMSTIIDSNMTTLISAAVLYAIGTDQIKGFAVTLFIGLVVSLYTAIFVARLLFDIAERKHLIERLRMMRFIGETHFDFVKWLWPAMITSSIVIGIGLAAAAIRGTDLYDIDFTGGSSVQILFDRGKAADIAEVRRQVDHLPDVAVSGVGTENLEFKIDTSERNIQKVQEELQKVFKDRLRTYTMKFSGLKVVERKAPAPAAAPANTPAPATPPADRSRQGASHNLRTNRNASRALELADAGGHSAAVTALLLSQAENGNGTPATPPPSPRQTGTQPAPAPQPAPETDRPAEARPAEARPAESTGAAEVPRIEPQPPASATPPVASPRAPTAPAAAPATPAAERSPASAPRSQPRATAPKPVADTLPAEVRTAGFDGTLRGKTTQVVLTFGEPISFPALSSRIRDQLKSAKMPDVEFELTNPRYREGSSTPLDRWTLKIALPEQTTKEILSEIQSQFASTPVFPSSNQIGGKVAGDTAQMALFALMAAVLMIIIYVWIRFQNVIFGLAAVLAVIHDVMVTIGFLALSAYLAPYLGVLLVDPFKISLAVVAALLTIVGFSINDTIVIFDRIREIRGKSTDLTGDMINLAVNQTLSRTLLTTGTVLTSTTILYVLGGQSIHPFAYAMLIGLISGTYSTVYIASPLLLLLRKSKPNQPARLAAGAARPSRV